MFSNLVPFENVLERIKDDTGLSNINNLRPQIRRLTKRVQHDLGYGGALILKRVPYSIVNGTIIDDGKVSKAKLPPDIVQIEKVGMCNEGLCPDMYLIQGNWLFFCRPYKVDSFSLLYWTALKDGEGNPVITENHLEAVAAGVTYYLYKQSVFNNKKSGNTMLYYENYYHERLAEARGNDIMPNSDMEYSRLSSLLRGSTLDAFYFDYHRGCFCELEESLLPEWIAPSGTPGGGEGYTDPTKTVDGNQSTDTGTGGSTDGDGGYDPEPTEPVEENQPASLSNIEISISTSEVKVITIAMFEDGAGAPYSDPENDDLAAVRVDYINPTNLGAWYFNGSPVVVGTIATRIDIIGELFVYVPSSSTEPHTDSISISVKDAVNGTWVN